MGTDQVFTKEKNSFEIIFHLEQSLIHESLAFGWEETRIRSPFLNKIKPSKKKPHATVTLKCKAQISWLYLGVYLSLNGPDEMLKVSISEECFTDRLYFCALHTTFLTRTE